MKPKEFVRRAKKLGFEFYRPKRAIIEPYFDCRLFSSLTNDIARLCMKKKPFTFKPIEVVDGEDIEHLINTDEDSCDLEELETYMNGGSFIDTKSKIPKKKRKIMWVCDR